MARPRTFDEVDVVARAAEAFGRIGYNACSVDDLVAATALQRGSLYKAFGSKRGLFVLDLLITVLRELAPTYLPIAALCRGALQAYGEGSAELMASAAVRWACAFQAPTSRA